MSFKYRVTSVAATFAISLATGIGFAGPATADDCTITAVSDVKTVGTEGNDIICGTSGNDVIDGGGGNDIIYGEAGDDTIDAGTGDDTIDAGDGDDNVLGDTGNDYITLGDGDDYSEGGEGADRLFGGDGADALQGDSGNDIIEGNIGDDVIQLGAGNDYAYGGPGGDSLFGGDGKDALLADEGSDSLDGGKGADRLNGGGGNDTDYCAKDKLDTLLNCFYDSKGPKVVSVSLSTKSIDTSNGPATVTVRLRATDKGSGVSNIGLTFIKLDKKGQPNWESGQISLWASPMGYMCEGGVTPEPGLDQWGNYIQQTGCLISGDSHNGIYEMKVAVPKLTAPGIYRLTNMHLSDGANNQTNLQLEDLKERKLAINFKQTGRGDSVGPAIKSLALSKKSVDTSSGAKIITLRANIRDGGAGIEQVFLSFTAIKKNNYWANPISFSWYSNSNVNSMSNPNGSCVNGHAAEPEGNMSTTACLISGTDKNAVIEFKTKLPAYSPKGSFQLTQAWMTDKAKNQRNLQLNQLKKAKLAVSFKQVGDGDSASPVVKSIKILNPVVDSGASEQFVYAKVAVKDNMSGLSTLNLNFARVVGKQTNWNSSVNGGFWLNSFNSSQDLACGPDGLPSEFNGSGCLLSGNIKNGVFIIKLRVPAHTAAGTYQLVGMWFSDVVGNQKNYNWPDSKGKYKVSFKNG